MILAWASNLFRFPRTRMTYSPCHRLPQGAIGSKLGLSCLPQQLLRGIRSNSNSAIRFRDMGYAIYNNIFIFRSVSYGVAHLSHAIAYNVPPVQFSLCIRGEAHVWKWGARVVCRLSAIFFIILKSVHSGSFLAHVGRFNVRSILCRLD